MPFNVTAAAAHIRRIVLKFNAEKMEVRYNAGEKYHQYQLKARKLEQEMADLERRLNAPVPDADNPDEVARLREAAEGVYQEVLGAIAETRRRVADNICTVIESWDLEADLDGLLDGILAEHNKAKAEDSEAEDIFGAAVEVLKDAELEPDGTRNVTVEGKAKKVPAFGYGAIPVSGLLLALLPLPDKFIFDVQDKIIEDFDSGGAGGKGR